MKAAKGHCCFRRPDKISGLSTAFFKRGNHVADNQRMAGQPPPRPASQLLIGRHAISHLKLLSMMSISSDDNKAFCKKKIAKAIAAANDLQAAAIIYYSFILVWFMQHALISSRLISDRLRQRSPWQFFAKCFIIIKHFAQ